jgi:hypothetical protein
MPDITLADFKANLKDAARPNRFLVTLTPPPGVGGASNEEMAYIIKAASLPGRTIGEVPLSWQGMQAKVAGDPVFDPWDVTFVNDYDMKAKKTMDDWLELVVNQTTNERTEQSEYKAELLVKQLGRTLSEVLGEYKIIGAFPTIMAPLDLAFETTDTAGEFTVTFTYDYFEKIS